MDTLPPKPPRPCSPRCSSPPKRPPDDYPRRRESTSRDPGSSPYHGGRRDDRLDSREDGRHLTRPRVDIDTYHPPPHYGPPRDRRESSYHERSRDYDSRPRGPAPRFDSRPSPPPRYPPRGGWSRDGPGRYPHPRDDRDDHDRDRDRPYGRDFDTRRREGPPPDRRFHGSDRDYRGSDGRRHGGYSDRYPRRSRSPPPRRRTPSPGPSSHYSRQRSPGPRSPSPKRIKLEDQPPRPRSMSPNRPGKGLLGHVVKVEPVGASISTAQPSSDNGVVSVPIRREGKPSVSPNLTPTIKQEHLMGDLKANSPIIPSPKPPVPEVADSILPTSSIKREAQSNTTHDKDGDVKMSRASYPSGSHLPPPRPNKSPVDVKPSSPLLGKQSPPRGPRRSSPPRHRHPSDKRRGGVDSHLPRAGARPQAGPDAGGPSSATASPTVPSAQQNQPMWPYSGFVNIKQEWVDTLRDRENVAAKTLIAVKQILLFANAKRELAQALYEVELSKLDVEAAERRRKIASAQLEKAIEGTLVPEHPDTSKRNVNPDAASGSRVGNAVEDD